MLLSGKSLDSDIKIVDFGFAVLTNDEREKEIHLPPQKQTQSSKTIETKAESLRSPSGTPGYMSPEILTNHDYTTKGDMWAVGVVMYILLCGAYPFKVYPGGWDTDKAITGDYNMQGPRWQPVSAFAKDMISKLLCVDVNSRLSAKEGTSSCPHSPPSIQPMCIHTHVMKYYALLCHIMFALKFPLPTHPRRPPLSSMARRNTAIIP